MLNHTWISNSWFFPVILHKNTATLVIILFKHIVGYLRLGCMARERGQIYEASDWFKEALQINQVTKYTIKRLANCVYFKTTLIIGQNCVVQSKIFILIFCWSGSPRCLVSDWKSPLGQARMGTRTEEVWANHWTTQHQGRCLLSDRPGQRVATDTTHTNERQG